MVVPWFVVPVIAPGSQRLWVSTDAGSSVPRSAWYPWNPGSRIATLTPLPVRPAPCQSGARGHSGALAHDVRREEHRCVDPLYAHVACQRSQFRKRDPRLERPTAYSAHASADGRDRRTRRANRALGADDDEGALGAQTNALRFRGTRGRQLPTGAEGVDDRLEPRIQRGRCSERRLLGNGGSAGGLPERGAGAAGEQKRTTDERREPVPCDLHTVTPSLAPAP